MGDLIKGLFANVWAGFGGSHGDGAAPGTEGQVEKGFLSLGMLRLDRDPHPILGPEASEGHSPPKTPQSNEPTTSFS